MPTQLTACSLPGCSEPIIPGRPAFRLGGYPGEYHDRGCMNIAFELLRKGKKFAKSQPEKVDYVKADERQEAAEAKEAASVKVKAEEFGGAEVYRRYCDNPACKGPVTVCWKGRRGEYCSNNCRKTEKDNINMTTEETTNESPIAAGAPATKKAKGKAATKKASATKKAAPASKAAKPAVAKAAKPAAAKGERDPRLPKVGSTMTHTHKGKELKIEVNAEGFKHGKTQYKSLSALACAITGYKTCNGFDFFKLNG